MILENTLKTIKNCIAPESNMMTSYCSINVVSQSVTIQVDR